MLILQHLRQQVQRDQQARGDFNKFKEINKPGESNDQKQERKDNREEEVRNSESTRPRAARMKVVRLVRC